MGLAASPCRPIFYHLFFLDFLIRFFFKHCHIHTHTLVKFVADRFSPSPTMQLTSRKQHLLLQYVHTHVFLSNNIKEEQGKNDSHPEKETNRKTGKKRKEIQIFVPCCNPPQMEKVLTLNTKISQFLYIKLPVLALV